MILDDTAIQREPGCLDEAWSSPGTFALVPRGAGVGSGWVADALAKVPHEHARGSFALLTSGSTGHPKLLIGRRERACELARVIHRAQDGEAAQETILALPLTYSYAFVNQWVWSRVMRRRLVPTAGLSEPASLIAALTAACAAMLCLVGAQVPMLLRSAGERTFPGVTRLHFAGGRFPAEHLSELRRLFPRAAVYTNFGCAEAMPRLTIRQVGQTHDPADVGYPIEGVELRSSSGEALEFRSCWGAVAQVDDSGVKELDGRWIATGDLGTIMPDGSCQLIGRASEVFKRYGEKVSLPALMMAVQRRWRGEAAFYRERDRQGEEGHVLVLGGEPGQDEVRAVLERLREDFSRTHWPLRIEALSLLDHLPSGKVDARALAMRKDAHVLWRQRL